MRLAAAGAIGAVAIAVLSDTVYPLGPGQTAVITRLGRTGDVAAVVQGGAGASLHLKWPIVERLSRFDLRPPPIELELPDLVTRDGQRVSLRVALDYRVSRPMRAARALGGSGQVAERMGVLARGAVRQAVAGATLANLLADADAAVSQPALAVLARRLPQTASGVAAQSLDITGARLSPLDAQAARERLHDALTAEAASLRAAAAADKREQMAEADRDAEAARGEGERQALVIRGQGDAERATILAQAYAKDGDFARVFRRLEAYDQALDPATTALVISPDSNAFLRTFGNGPQGARR